MNTYHSGPNASDEEHRADDALLPVHTLEDLSRADLGNARVVRMVVNDALADRAEEFQARGMSQGEGGSGAATVGAGEGNSPFHSGRQGQEDSLRPEE